MKHNPDNEGALFDSIEGVPHFCGLSVETHEITVAQRTVRIASLKDAAALLDQPDFAGRFVEEDLAPYGLELWPASRQLADQILAGEPGADRLALDLGCGLGLVAIAASMRGWRVTGGDHDATALRFSRHNAELNGTRVHEFIAFDWHDPPPNLAFERIFAADVLYQLVDHVPILRCIDAVLADGGNALLIDPNRRVADRFASVAEEYGFDVETTCSSSAASKGRIFRLQRR